MRGNATVDYRNPRVIRRLGVDVLTKELGPDGMAYFIQQFDRGEGDYTAERGKWLDDMTVEDAMKEIKAMRSNQQD
ncbi:hypothetical protein AGMMS49983_12570 [Clostridia bacterium]|nr:hypothetical protein AGMMS49983_12570 [Clostridia bacterium]